jgi:hypothetical protein
MIYRRFAHAIIGVFDSIFAIGGYTHLNKPGIDAISLRSVEKFNIVSQEWIEVSPLNTARAFFGAVTIMD